MAKFKGTENADTYTLREGKRDVVQMLGGDDTVYLSAASFGSDDKIDAGEGQFDNAVLVEGGFYNFGHDRLIGFENLTMRGSGAFEIYVDDSVTRAGQTMLITASQTVGDKAHPVSLFVDGAPERDGALLVVGSTGDDVMIGGFGDDQFQARDGNDLMTGNDGADDFVFEADEFGRDNWGKDRVTDFHPGEDTLYFATRSADSFDDLLIRKTHEGLVIRTPGSSSSVTLLGVLPKELHASDFAFYPAQDGPHGHHSLAFPHDGPLA